MAKEMQADLIKIKKMFEALSDETRLRIAMVLSEGKKNVTEIHHSIGKSKMTISAISHQLRKMHDAEIVASEKIGKEKYYCLSDKYCWCMLKKGINYFAKKNCRTCKD